MKKLFPLLFTGLCSMCFAQQDPLYAQYLNNPIVINPAYAGMGNDLSAAITYRQQWTGYEGNPQTLAANAHVSLHENRMGAGLMLLSDKTAVTTINEAIGVYSYRIKLSADNVLSFGLQAGITNITIDNTQLLIQDPGDPMFSGKTSETKPTFGAGILVSGDRFMIGLSVPRMLKITNTVAGLDNDLYTQHFYALGSYHFFVNENVRFKPSVLAKIVQGAPLSLDLNAAFTFHERYTAGILTRNFKTAGVLLQGQFNAFRLGYVIEVPTGKTTVGFSHLTHEITFGIKATVFSFHKNTVTSF